MLVALAFPAGASAHAFLLQTIPADHSVSATPPTQVLVSFNDTVNVGPGNTVVGAGGGSVLAGPPRAHGKTLVLPLQSGLPNGDYSVRWSIISDDGHLEQGVLAFGVGTGPPPTSTLRARTGVGVVTMLLRWLFLSALFITAGVALFDLLVWRGVPREWFGAGEATLAVAAAALVYHSGAGLSTRFGLAVSIAGIAAAAIAVAATLMFIPRRLVSVAALAPLPVPTLAGHALDAGRSWVDAPIDFVHVLAVSFWLGGLVVLALIVASREAGRRFARLAVLAVVLIAATGVGNALAELRSFSQLWTTGYGESILVKSGLFVAALAFGWASRSRLSIRSVRSEVVILLGVVATVGVLTSLPPGKAVRALASTATQAGIPELPASDAVVLGQRDGNLVAGIAVRPSGDATATFLGTDDKLTDVGAVTIDGGSTTSCGVGCYRGKAHDTGVVTVAHGAVSLSFDLGTPLPAATLIANVSQTYQHARSTVYDVKLATGLAAPLAAHWVEIAPNSYSFRLASGSEAIVIGTRRWDRQRGSGWKPSKIVATAGPTPLWGYGPITNAHVLRELPKTFVVSFFGASTTYPAWFRAVVDRSTLHLVSLRMTAAAHFMNVRYEAWNEQASIRPPRG